MSTSRQEYERQVNWRKKQVSIGKESSAYIAYSQSIPRNRRRKEHPQTPDPYDARMSKRQYEGRIKAWRRALHDLYPAKPSLQGTTKMFFFLKNSERDQLGRLEVCGEVVDEPLGTGELKIFEGD